VSNLCKNTADVSRGCGLQSGQNINWSDNIYNTCILWNVYANRGTLYAL